MSNIDIRKFVDVSIVHHSIASLNTTRDTTVMLVDDSDYQATDSIVASKSAAYSLLNLTSESTVPEKLYIDSYFDNGGQKLHIMSIQGTGTDNAVIPADIVLEMQRLPDEEIVIAYPLNSDVLEEAIDTLNQNSKFYGIKLKLAVAAVNGWSGTAHVIEQETSKHEYGCIAAYLSKIDISKPNSVKDFDFTPVKAEAQSLTDEELDVLMSNHQNVAIKLAGQTRIIGGDTMDGQDLVNEFMLIVLQQTVTQKVLNVLVEKLKGETGVAAIHTAIAQELSRYITNGYLATDKVWTDETLTISYGNPPQTYTVIEQNTPLLLGYQIKILPYNSLTVEDKAAHKAPPIYIVLADSYGIRKVTINGEVY